MAKKTVKESKGTGAGLPQYLVDAIRKAWPEGVVDMPDTDESPFWNKYPKLKTSLSRIRGARILYEYAPNSAEIEIDDGLFTDWREESRSYCVLFLSPADEIFRFQSDTLEPDEDGVEQTVPGHGFLGCVVGISLIAPFAIVSYDQMEIFESGSRMDPDVEPHIFSVDGGKRDLDVHVREMVDEEGLSVLRKLRAQIAGVLKKYQIEVIAETDTDRTVPWLRAGEEMFTRQGEPVTVQQSFFFRGL